MLMCLVTMIPLCGCNSELNSEIQVSLPTRDRRDERLIFTFSLTVEQSVVLEHYCGGLPSWRRPCLCRPDTQKKNAEMNFLLSWLME